MPNGRTDLNIFDTGSVTGDRYCQEVIISHKGLFRGAIGADFLLMAVNARPHRTHAVQQLLEMKIFLDWIGQHTPPIKIRKNMCGVLWGDAL